MADDIAALRAQRDALRRTKRSGTLSVRHGDRLVTYRSIEEIDRALLDLECEIAAAEGRRRPRRMLVTVLSKGL